MSEKTPREISDKLQKPFGREAIKQRSGGGSRKYDYVETQTVIRRLNEATDNHWDYVITRLEWHGDLLIATGELTIPGLGTRSGTGVQKVNDKSEDLIKGAASDCLKNCAKLFGVALDLCGDDYEAHGEPPDNQRQPKRQPSRQPAPTDEGLPGEKKPSHYKLTPEQKKQIEDLRDAIGAPKATFDAWIRDTHTNQRPLEGLTMTEADAVIATLTKRLEAKRAKEEPKQAPQGEDLDLGAF